MVRKSLIFAVVFATCFSANAADSGCIAAIVGTVCLTASSCGPVLPGLVCPKKTEQCLQGTETTCPCSCVTKATGCVRRYTLPETDEEQQQLVINQPPILRTS